DPVACRVSLPSRNAWFVVQMNANRRLRLDQSQPRRWINSGESGIEDEQVLALVFESMKWDIHTLCATASINRKLRAIARRLLWRMLCLHRAPRMAAALSDSKPNGRIDGGWHTLAKVMFFCCGSESTRHFELSRPSPGHFVRESRFSKTSGRSFLAKRCRGDLLYVSDPCEHRTGEAEDDLGIFRGVFKGFMRSKTRECLVRRRAELEENVRCPYCGARVWSMTAARLVPRSAARRLGSRDGGVEFFVCVNGHLHGTCWLVRLSSDEDRREYDDDDDEEDDDFDCGE
ncbi:PREDICTED: EID1-like F-box protein 3, partial [Tarenaya hassleriana]|uniref:EID1-like F-box protein 3 n=1 Tax=Tarenaya hassleriana TaxID=28532 RepID=UPI0008FD87C2